MKLYPKPSSQAAIMNEISALTKAFGFDAVGVSQIDLSQAEQRLLDWLGKGYHGEMEWMQRHGTRRSRPEELVPGTLSVISVRMNYLPPDSADPEMVVNHPELGYISRYALGRDYHKVLRQRLEKVARHLQEKVAPFAYRVFTDSAPVLEKPLAINAGLGWMGKHTNILDRSAGSWFFLGEIYTTLPLESNTAVTEHCGACTACIDICPTKAIIAPYQLDARLCISYLTIEHPGSIPVELRSLIGNRIYGCDDCQLICPWNRFAKTSPLADFTVRQALDAPRLKDLFCWSEADFLNKLQGSPIRRIGYQRWRRNIAVALGNAPKSPELMQLLEQAEKTIKDDMVVEHVSWAINKQVQAM